MSFLAFVLVVLVLPVLKASTSSYKAGCALGQPDSLPKPSRTAGGLLAGFWRAWVIRNQFARRNLTPFQRIELAARLEECLRAKAKERQRCGQGGTLLVQNSAQATGKVRDELATVAGVSHDTMGRGLKLVKTAPEEVKAKLRAGELGGPVAQFVGPATA